MSNGQWRAAANRRSHCRGEPARRLLPCPEAEGPTIAIAQPLRRPHATTSIIVLCPPGLSLLLLPLTLRFRHHWAVGGGFDPSIAVDSDGAWVAAWTPDGPATLHFTQADSITAEAWGPGADAALEAAPGICGATDDPSGFEPMHPVVQRLVRRFPGARVTRTGAVVESLVRMIVAQRVTGTEATKGIYPYGA